MKRNCGCGGEIVRERVKQLVGPFRNQVQVGGRRYICRRPTCRKVHRIVYQSKADLARDADRRLARKRRGTRGATNGGGAHGARTTKGAAHQARRRWVAGIDWAHGPDRSVTVTWRDGKIVGVR